jgi:hypothetical protein
MTQEQPEAVQGNPPECGNMPYQEATDPAFAEKAAKTFTASRDADGTISLMGHCPRCHANMEVFVPGEIFIANRFGFFGRLLGRTGSASSTANNDEQDVPIACLCAAPHPGRPSNRTGCGAYWRLKVGGLP